MIHCAIKHYATNTHIFCSFIYGHNDDRNRLTLWNDLVSLNPITSAWVVLGDFNIVRSLEEKSSNNLPFVEDMKSFNDCLTLCNLDDVKTTGLDFSWTNIQNSDSRVWSRIDRAVINSHWLDIYPNSFSTLLPSGVSDHSPLLVTIFEDAKHVARFSYLNSWQSHETYDSIVLTVWNERVSCRNMYKLFARLKKLKQAFTALYKAHFGRINVHVKEVKQALLDCLTKLLGTAVPVLPIDNDITGPMINSDDWDSLIKDVTPSE